VLISSDLIGAMGEAEKEQEDQTVESENVSAAVDAPQQPDEKTPDKPVETDTVKPQDNQRPADKPADKPVDKPADKPSQNTNQNTSSSQEHSSTSDSASQTAPESEYNIDDLFATDTAVSDSTEYVEVDDSSSSSSSNSSDSSSQNSQNNSDDSSIYSDDQFESLADNSVSSDGNNSSGSESASGDGTPDRSDVPLSIADLKKTRNILKQGAFDFGSLDMGGRKFINVIVKITVTPGGVVSRAKVTSTGNAQADRVIETTMTNKWLFSPVQGAGNQNYTVKITINLK
jgi:hypothetical protein